LVLGVLAGCGALVLAEDPAKPSDSAARLPVGKPETTAKEPEKTITFQMRNKPWNEVLEWLADQTGIPVSTDYHPTGTFTFIAPKAGSQRYTIPQVIDIINEQLTSQKYVLIRRSQTFTIVPADVKIDPSILPRVLPEELEKRGNTELVSVVLPLNSLVAEDIAPEVKQMKGPFGEVVALTKANQLLLQDTVGNLKRIRDTIQKLEEDYKNQADTYTHSCTYIKAMDAAKTLKELLPDPRELLRAMQPQQPLFPFGGGGGRGGFGGGGFGGGGFGGGGGGFQGGQPQQQAQANPAITPKIRMHYITADERTNTVVIVGPADKIAQAKEILRRIDVRQGNQPPVLVGQPVFKSYPVPNGNAEAIAKTLQDIYKASSTTRISAVGNSSILVYAGPEEQFEIAKHITSAKEQGGGVEVVMLNALEAAKVVETLKGMFGNDTKTGAPYLEADTAKNAITVKGTTDQVAEVKAVLKALGEEGGAAAGNMRIITLDKGNAAALAEALKQMLEQMRENPVNVITPGSEQNKRKAEPVPAPNRRSNERPSRSDQRKSAVLWERSGVEEVQLVSHEQLVDPQQPAPKSTKPGNKNAPINITAIGNKIIITSDDPKALQMAQELVRLMTQTPGGTGGFEVIRLKNASAADAAKTLDEAFNGPKQQVQQPFPFFGGGPFGQRQQVATPPREERIRVVADPASNSILVKASPLDMLEVRRLLKDAIDSGDTNSAAVIKSWLLPPLKYASATEVASVIKDVYRENMNQTAINMQVGGFPGFGFGGGGRRFTQFAQPVDANGNPKQVTLSVGVDDRTNSLVLNCSEAMYNDIKKLVTQLDAAAKDSTRTVKVVSIKGIDPLLVQQAIDAIQGRRTNLPNTNGFGNGNFGRQGGNPGMNQFQPFGGGRGGQGGGQGGGGGGRGGGGAARPPGAMRGPPPGGLSRGPDFFDDRVMDDPQPSLLFDPQHPSTDAEQVTSTSNNSEATQLTSLEEQQQAQPPTTTPPPSGDIRGPRSAVTAEALEELGVIVISGNNPADVEEVVRIIEYIQRLGAGAEVRIELVPLAFADATSVANTLTQLYLRVVVNAAGNVRTSTPTQPTTILGQFGVATTPTQQAASVVLLPLPRYNSILLAAPKARVDDIIKEIKRLDRKTTPQGHPLPFPLKKATASRVAALLTNFYAQRYPNETAALHGIRITEDDSINTVFVQAAPADLEEIRELIERIDNTVSNAVNDVRIIYLRNALADELATLLGQAIAQGVTGPSAVPTPSVTPAAAGLGGAPLGGLRQAGGIPGLGQAGLGLPAFGQPGVTPTAAPAAAAAPLPAGAKGTTLRFISMRPDQRGVAESGLLEDIRITPDARINALILSAPAKTIELLLALIRDLDVPPPARAEVKVFALKKADASTMANTLQQLFLGTGGAAPTPTAGGPGAPGAVPGAGLGAAPTAAGVAAAIPRALFTLGGITPEGAPLIPLSISAEVRTNSVIVAGSRNDLDVVEAIIFRIEDSDILARRHEVYHLRNTSASDVATALQNFLTSSLAVITRAGQFTSQIEIERDVVLVPEPISNQLLISASVRYFDEIMRLVHELDIQPPQVVIQVLIAEVDLSSNEEFGVELGLQSPVLFQRGVVPSPDLIGAGSVNFANATGGLVPPGVTVNSTINPAAQPGFDFNNVTLPLGNNPGAPGPGIVGFQGLSNLGVGRVSPTSNVGGFVFSASSDVFNLLIRALKTQGRMDILSRPQIMTLDNQTATVNIGQNIPIVSSTFVSATGSATQSIERLNVGVNLQVTPRINPDGTVLMRVTPQISSVLSTTVPLGNGTFGTSINLQQVDTTVLAADGETVAIGGLIQKRDQKNENKVPWFGDLPYLGALFRYRTQAKSKTELLVIMTPHVVRSRLDADRILSEESQKISWCPGDVVKMQGPSGLEPILPPPSPGRHAAEILGLPATPVPVLPYGPSPVPGPQAVPEPGREVLPQPKIVPGAAGQNPPTLGLPGTVFQELPPSGASSPSTVPMPADQAAAPAAQPQKESRAWKLFRRGQ
jgi:type II secretory pathway component GspD/PulD (secretin)